MRRTPGKLAVTAPPARSSGRLLDERQHLDDVELAQVGERLQVHALVQLALLAVDPGHPADRDPAREQRLDAARTATRTSPRSRPCAPARPFWTKSSSRSEGLPTVALTRPFAPSGTTCAETPLVWSVISVTCAASDETSETRPTRPSPLTTGWFGAHALVRALVDRDRRVPDRRRAPDHARADVLVAVREARRAVEADQRAQLPDVALRRSAPRPARARSRSTSLSQLLVLRLGVEHVADPAGRNRAPASAPGWRLPGVAPSPPGSRAGSRAGHPRRIRRSRR